MRSTSAGILEFTALRELVGRFVASPLGRAKLDKIQPYTSREKLDEDLAEALALAHDLGHPPFGHAGEEALNVAMKPFGGFDHNAQSLRVLTMLESRYAAFDGLNLTWETLEGLAKHNGPVPDFAFRSTKFFGVRAGQGREIHPRGPRQEVLDIVPHRN